MKKVVLFRQYYNDHTRGYFTGLGHAIDTLEKPFKFNERNVSCIPEGTYKCKKGQNSKGVNVIHVLNVPNRSAIQIHIANTLNDISGCIGVGKYVTSSKTLINSRTTFEKIYNDLDNEFELTITNAPFFLSY